MQQYGSARLSVVTLNWILKRNSIIERIFTHSLTHSPPPRYVCRDFYDVDDEGYEEDVLGVERASPGEDEPEEAGAESMLARAGCVVSLLPSTP